VRAPKPPAEDAAALERIDNAVKAGVIEDSKGAPVGESGGPQP